MRLSGLRSRIAAAIAASSIGVMFAYAAVLYLASEQLEFELAHQLASEELGFLVSRHEADPGFVPTAGRRISYYIASKPSERAQQPDYLSDLTDGQHEINVGSGLGGRHIAVRTVGDTRYAVVYDIGPYEDRESEFGVVVVALLTAVIAISLGLGYWLAGILTRQLTMLARRVSDLPPAADTLSLAQPDQEPEVAAVAHALDQYRAQMSGMLKREQEFTANASHELRTPLTAIKTSCEIILKKASLDADVQSRIAFIREAADEMSLQVEALLFLAREQTEWDREFVDLQECVSDAVALLRTDIARKALALEIAIPDDIVIETNRQALYLVISNLLRNAINYTDQGNVNVTYHAGQLVIRDTGVGISPEHVPKIFERHYRAQTNGDGSGIGLDIVKRISDRMGWALRVDSRVGAGSEFGVTLTPPAAMPRE